MANQLPQYQSNIPQLNIPIPNATPQAPLQGISDSLYRGQSLGLQAQATQQKQQELQQQEKEMAMKNIEMQSSVMTQPWFRGMDQQHKNAFFSGFTSNLSKVTGMPLDTNQPFEDADVTYVKHLGDVWDDKTLSPTDKITASKSILLNASQNGVQPQKLGQLKDIVEMGMNQQVQNLTPQQFKAVMSGDEAAMGTAFPSGIPLHVASLGAAQGRFGMGQENKTEQQWQKLAGKVNVLNQSSRTALGIAATANMRADRLMMLANDPNATPQDIHNEMVDLEGIMTGGVPHEVSLKYGGFDNLKQRLARVNQFITSNPTAANNPELQARLKDVALGLKQVDNKIVNDNLGINAVGYRKLIDSDRMRWNDLVDQVQGTTQMAQPSSGSPQSGQIPTVGSKYNGANVLKVERID